MYDINSMVIKCNNIQELKTCVFLGIKIVSLKYSFAGYKSIKYQVKVTNYKTLWQLKNKDKVISRNSIFPHF